MWEVFSCILQGYGAEESMENILKTQDLCTYEESSSVFWSLYKGLDSTKSCPAGAVWIRWGQDWSKTRCCSWRPSTHQQRKRRCGFATQTPRSLRLASKRLMLVIFCFLKVILFCCIILLFTEMVRKFTCMVCESSRPTYILINVVWWWLAK